MKTTITLTRQLGSAGSYLGRLIADRFGLRYIDREVLHLVAEEFGVDPEALGPREEKLSSFWQKTMRGFVFGSPYASYAPPPLAVITDQKLFEKLTEIMKVLAAENDCVIVGWGGAYVLPRHDRMMTIYCHAPLKFRMDRVREIYGATDESDAAKMIAESDEMRSRYILQMTDKNWADAENYDLSVNTSFLPLEKTAEIICEAIRQKGIAAKD